LEGIEAAEDELTESIVSSGEGAWGTAMTNKFPSVADSVRTGSAGVGNDRERAAAIDGFGKIEALALALVFYGKAGAPWASMFGKNGVAKKRFAGFGAATSRAQDDGERIGRFPAALVPGFERGMKEHTAAASEAALRTLA
jgi:hypothetical protein